MSEKPKRKRGPSRWSFPRSFRYEIKGGFQHVIQAIESLTVKQKDRFHNYDVQIFPGALDEETAFSICSYRLAGEIDTEESDKNRVINAEAYGHVRSIQPGSVVVEGYALMSARGCVWGIIIVCILIVCGILLEPHHTQRFSVCGFGVVLVIPITLLLVIQSSFEQFFKDFLTALQTYPMPTDEDALNFTPDSETSQSQFESVEKDTHD